MGPKACLNTKSVRIFKNKVFCIIFILVNRNLFLVNKSEFHTATDSKLDVQVCQTTDWVKLQKIIYLIQCMLLVMIRHHFDVCVFLGDGGPKL